MPLTLKLPRGPSMDPSKQTKKIICLLAGF